MSYTLSPLWESFTLINLTHITDKEMTKFMQIYQIDCVLKKQHEKIWSFGNRGQPDIIDNAVYVACTNDIVNDVSNKFLNLLNLQISHFLLQSRLVMFKQGLFKMS